MGSVVVAAARSEIPIEVSPLPAGPIRPSTLPETTARSTAARDPPPWCEPAPPGVSTSRGEWFFVVSENGCPKGHSTLIEHVFDFSMSVYSSAMDLAQLKRWGDGHFPEHLGIVVAEAEHGRIVMAMPVHQHLLAPNGYLHAGAVVAIADTACGYGCMASLPEGAGFTTIELKTNFIGTAKDGTVRCEAIMAHGGRTTQVWDANVRNETGKTIAHFRCTQLLLYP